MHRIECNECDHTFHSSDALGQHKQAAHPPRFQCTYCDRIFNSSGWRDRHEAAVHGFQCVDCKKAFSSQSSLKQHRQGKHPFQCNYCNRIFGSTEARDHHEGALHLAHKCDNCDKAFFTSDALEQHKRNNHPSFPCHYCNRVFKSAQVCSQHEAYVHHTHKCDACGRWFFSSAALEQHKRDIHPSFKCGYCDRVFKSVAGCSQHEAETHPTHKCDQCDKAFLSSDTLDQHKRDNHPSFGCAHCGRIFKSAEACSRHGASAHPAHKCDECDRTFSSLDSLGQHKLHKHASLQCHHCSCAFKSIEARDQHADAVHPVLPCHKCSKRFRSPNTLEQHQRDEHPSLKCNFCDLEFSSSALRDGHEVAAHLYPCTQCGRYFKSADLLQHHVSALHDVDVEHHGTSDQQNVGHRIEQLQSPAQTLCHETALHANSCVGNSTMVVFTPHPDASRTPPELGSSEQQLSDPESASAGQASSLHSPVSYASAVDDSESPMEVYCVKEDSNDIGDGLGTHCWRCGDVFDAEEDFRNHNCGFLGTEIPLHCSDCYSCFEDEASLQQHLAKRIAFACRWCGLQFCFEGLLQDHMESHLKCRKCGISFGDESQLYRHTEHEHPVVVCWECGGAVILQDSLDLHYASEHPTCTICGVRMKERSMLDEHVNSEHVNSERPLESDRISESQDGQCNLTQTDSQSSSGEISIDDESHSNAVPSESLSPSTPDLSESSAHRGDDSLTDSDPEKENTGDLRQIPSPLLTPSVTSSDANQSNCDNLAGKETLPHSDTQPVSPNSSFLTESYDSISDQTTSTSSSQSVVYVTVDSIAEYVRENRAYLVATSAPSAPSTTTSPLRLPSALSSLDSVELAPRVSDASTPSTVTPSRNEIHLHCRVCNRDPCEDMTATICGHIFCNSCITQAVVSKSECPVCKSATLLYCLFRLDLTT
ncbi:hypothetical protein EDC04DRAFT_387320 [Pisolithus marmoratus]|nr:hypothetical protein EDC04DRAFT_387320 [Pisolithus marmoratus]